jgi:hypothetical protein
MTTSSLRQAQDTAGVVSSGLSSGLYRDKDMAGLAERLRKESFSGSSASPGASIGRGSVCLSLQMILFAHSPFRCVIGSSTGSKSTPNS